MQETPTAQPNWKISSHSNQGNCVEVGSIEKTILVRHSKHPHEQVLRFPPKSWEGFLVALRSETLVRPEPPATASSTEH